MIVRLTGKLETLDGNAAVVTPEGGGGVSYEVLLPAYLAERFAEGGMVGKTVSLRTLEYLEGVGQGTSFVPRILGFASAREREFFGLFTTVKGLGNKRALRALAVEPGEIAAAIMSRDARMLTKLPEIGKRLAETIIAELSGKVDGYADLSLRPELAGGVGRGGGPVSPGAEEAVNALVALGEGRADAERLVARAVQRDPGLRTTEEILQGALAAR